MKKLLLIFLFIFNYATELKIATYNVENLFDMQYNGSEYKEFIPNRHNWNRYILNKKLKNISKVICELNADVLGLEEIENKNALNLLLKTLRKRGCNYPYSAITNKKGSAIQVALISKVPIKQRRDIIVSNKPRDRDILEVDLKTNPKLKIFVNHWRSKAAPESQRVKYAKALVKRLNELPKNSEYIILGDFNSNYNECKNIEKKLNDTEGICGIDDILKTYKDGKLLTLEDKNISSMYHYNLWSEVEPYKRWSHSFYGKKGSLDSIIISKTLYDNSGWHYKKGSFGVFKQDYLFKNGRVFSWQYKNNKHSGKGYSDHLPLYAIFSNDDNKSSSNESLIDKFFELFIPKVKSEQKIKKEPKPKETTIGYLKSRKYAKNIILKDVCITFKRDMSGVLSDKKDFIFIYKAAENLKEGYCYNLLIKKKSRYYKTDEILDLKVLKELKRVNVDDYILDFNLNMLLNDKYLGAIVKNIRGAYSNGYLNIKGVKVKLFLKGKRKGFLKNGSILYIKKAQIGYYKGEKELIVYSIDDIIKEN